MEKTIIGHHENLKSVHYANPFTQEIDPLIVLFPAFEGHSEFICTYAQRLVDQGFQTFVADMYGNGAHYQELDSCFAALKPLQDDPELLRRRALENVHAALEFADLEADDIGLMGFCFGGKCALEVVRSGLEIPAVFAAHSTLSKGPLASNCTNITNIMLAQGYDDPLVLATELDSFAKEMVEINWNCIFYGNTKHSFTDNNVGQMDATAEAKMGREYHALSAQQCFNQAVMFFENIL